MQNETGVRSFQCGEALESKRHVKLDAANGFQLVYADAGEVGIGITQLKGAQDDWIPVRVWNDTGTFEITVAGDTAVNARLYPAADGKFSATPAGPCLFKGLAAGSAGAIVEAARYNGPAEAGLKAGSVDVAADELAIPLTHGIVKKTTGADAEALTLADGTPRQDLLIILDTDGNGDGTLTPSTSTGFATIVFADAGDQALLHYVDDTIGWVIQGLAGVAAPPAITV